MVLFSGEKLRAPAELYTVYLSPVKLPDGSGPRVRLANLATVGSRERLGREHAPKPVDEACT